ncbi:hypothetical protein BAU15_09655 [Enterococcus sp. JM4C]|uniref:cell division site-positioning protein MapZ family protein n=1 Tax=Candidatus Enterococcus huntleyi TaxID=1857217 RepID=UPI00137A5429|nr:cell division site-positioning protein MapZ family protein [Enterococcus sp. JM4C]KAF1298104.1 hypothetical protein BAU15_09655 [Enterococcus sp. JM4C]
MGKKCPNCGFKYKDDLDSCPKCGFDLKKQSIDELTEDKNDDIKWSDYGDVPLESMMEMFTETPDSEANETNESTNEETDKSEDIVENKSEELESSSQSEPDIGQKETEQTTLSEELEQPDEPESLKDSEATDESEEPEELKESVELDEEDTENSLLAAYIREHRGEEVNGSSEAEATANDSIEKAREEESDSPELPENASNQDKQANQTVQVDQPEQKNQVDQKEVVDQGHLTEQAQTQSTEDMSVEQESEEAADEKLSEVSSDAVSAEVTSKELEKNSLDENAVETADVKKGAANEEKSDEDKLTESVTPTPIFGEAPKAPDTNEVILDEVELLEAEPLEKAATSESTEPEQKTTSHKKRNIARGITAVAVLILGASAWTVYSQNKKAAEAQQVEETKKKATELEAIQQNLDEFYTDDTHEFIRTEKVSADLTKLSSQLSALKDQKGYEKVAEEFKDVSDKVAMINKVNALFTGAVISDDTLIKEPLLKEDKQIGLEASTETSGFAKLMNEAIATAQSQFDELQTAKELVDVIYVNGKVTDKANKENYDAAKKAVENVKNKELAKELTIGLQAVKKQIDTEANKAKEATQKAEANKQAEAAKQAETANKTTSAETNVSAQNSGGSAAVPNVEWTYDSQGMRHPVFQKNNQGLPILSSRQSDIADVNNAAWSWADGVKDHVLSIAFSRGYIVEGGYYLEPARIEAGEGFYNLYATKPSNLLSSDYSFPVYLMTINCKTGWFGGNGSDQTQ